MRAVPVHPAARLAPGEAVVAPSGTRFELVGDMMFWHTHQFPIAAGASRPRGERGREPVQDVGQLLTWPSAADVRPGPEGASHEQSAVLSEQYASLFRGLE